MSNLMTVEEAEGVCKDRSKWKEVISAYPKVKRAAIPVLLVSSVDSRNTFATDYHISQDCPISERANR
jgi:hypothetical protein